LFAQQIWKRAYPNINHEQIATRVFGRLEKHINEIPQLDGAETGFSPTYSYKRQEINEKLAKAQPIVSQID